MPESIEIPKVYMQLQTVLNLVLSTSLQESKCTANSCLRFHELKTLFVLCVYIKYMCVHTLSDIYIYVYTYMYICTVYAVFIYTVYACVYIYYI